MKAGKDMKRLYVGGLGHNISEADLQNQFNRFGEVSDVEIITRKDNQGNPQKVFAYINIKVAETDLKKCMSALNKTKWKGGTLQIQLAKESFLHRLAQEREAARSMKENSTASTNLFEKTKVDFYIKAVPGTEVPGHKNWVVSKFGRVLPVLHLKNQHKRKIIKYDPSKYCHNLKKIGEDFTDTIPISSLTWELEGGNDPMSKKRRGEFSDFHCPPKKIIKVQKDDGSTGSLVIKPKPNVATKNPHFTQQEAAAKTSRDSFTSKSTHVPNSDAQKLKNASLKNSSLEAIRNKITMSDDDIDSEDELRQLIAREENLEKTRRSSVNESENDPFEVVKEEFKSDIHKLHSLTSLGIRNDVSCLDGDHNVKGNDCDYDSGDTDEIIAVKKNYGEVKKSTEFSQMKKAIHKKTLKNRKDCELPDHCIKVQKRNNVKVATHQGAKPLDCKSPIASGSKDADSVSESAESIDEEYSAMMKNCLRVNLTLADLEQLAGRKLEAPGEDTEVSVEETTAIFNRASKNPRTPSGFHRGRRCIQPEEIVASLLEGEENIVGKQKPKEGNLKSKFQAFKGIACLYGKELTKKSLKEGVAANNINKDQDSVKLEESCSISLGKTQGTSSKTPFQQPKKATDSNHIQPPKRQDLMVVSPSSSEKGSKTPISCLLTLNNKKSLSLGAKTLKMGFDKARTTKTEEDLEKKPDLRSGATPEKSSVSSRRGTQGSKTDSLLCANSLSDVDAKQKHAEDNQRRLAALEARQKAKEVQKKLVQDALANLDGHPEDKSTHIIFGSDSESETEVLSTWEQKQPGEEPVKASAGRAPGKLFDNSGDEESGPEDDTNRFRIKPQFEGKAGQKLMNLQSHFGTDDRFRMDSRFLESESEEEQEEINERKTAEEEELAAEKLKALNVVQSVLNINLSTPTSKGSVAAKKFKDIIHYDPTRHDHAAYERKRDDKPKESKAKRKKKREEAEKLPEVSKEMYYNIATDLKEIFQTTKDTSEKDDNIPWNEDCSGEEVQDSATSENGAQQPGGFTFSFFDSDTEIIKEDTYKLETVKPGKVAWQGAFHFHDSSSEEEEEDVNEEPEDRKPSPTDVSLPEKETTRFFFFSKIDERLNGSDLFWRGVGSNISRSSWEARTDNLRMDCRKKHKDAKRRVKPN
ncbi:PREDICTED: nucleolar protein 8 [Condylura cristata]|uniref:nucleolar protein 8 n=1 Tax=Condylura cristata TaxID=143302 RepID=UPI0003347308|nr:PREDICTED: nucleolar protein 8 [Condylura cristata]XP_012582162.1 PREDICTED: nucleolar protein 8 [Condylura cristata]